ncbi:MAG: IPT/TIG domain-containing protein [Actinobacteria bacterium]|nr:IPT/TIG domain-containing protein [Actinomycetota bacterium]MBV8597830.1 IPT/TIG domain-containing protein [Actinomycetota bacterium]
MRTRTGYLGVFLALVGTLCLLAGTASARPLDSTPTISSFSPTQALHGQKVVITGTGFSNATAVQIDAINAQFTVDSDTQITAVIPSEVPAGKWNIDVLTSTGQVSSSQQFNVLPAGAVLPAGKDYRPQITKLTPSRGHVGSYIVITGKNLNGAQWVKLGGVKIPFTVPSATSIHAVVNAKAHSGWLTLMTNYGLARSPARFTIAAGVLAAKH